MLKYSRSSKLAQCFRLIAAGALFPLAGFCAAAGAPAGVDPALAALITRCAPSVAPGTMSAVISAESRGNIYAIADAGPVRLPWSQRKHLVRSFNMGSLREAVAKAHELLSQGHTVSLGLTQVNDRNLPSLGLNLEQVFEPCTNIAAGARILTGFYQSASRKFGPGPRALHAALSAYNSGDFTRGARDGYVHLVYKQAGRSLTLRTERSAPSRSRPLIARAAFVPVIVRGPGNAGGGDRVFAMSSSDFSVTK